MSDDKVTIPADGWPYRVNMAGNTMGVSMQFIGQQPSKPVLIIRPDGRIELGEGCTNADAAQVLVDLANKVCAARANECVAHTIGHSVALAPSAWLLMDDERVVGSTTNRQEADGWARGPLHTIEPLHRIRRGG